MARFTQLIILSAASQREDHGVELPANLKGEAARKVVDKLIREAARPELPKPATRLLNWRSHRCHRAWLLTVTCMPPLSAL